MRLSLEELNNSNNTGNNDDVNSTNGMSSRNSSNGFSNDLDGNTDWEKLCLQDGRVYVQGEEWDVDSCTTCGCLVMRLFKLGVTFRGYCRSSIKVLSILSLALLITKGLLSSDVNPKHL